MNHDTTIIEIFLYTLLNCLCGYEGPVTVIQDTWVSTGQKVGFTSVVGAALVIHGMEWMKPIIAQTRRSIGFNITGMITTGAWDTTLPKYFNPVESANVALVASLVGLRRVASVWVMLGGKGMGLLVWRRT